MTEQYNSDRPEPNLDEVFMSMNSAPTNTDTCWVPLTVGQMKALVARLSYMPDLGEDEQGAYAVIEDFLSAFTEVEQDSICAHLVVVERPVPILEADSIDG
jgi:hypothetical protein